MGDWKAQVGRVTLFPAVAFSPGPSALSLFKELWAGEPDSFQKPTNPLMPTLAQARRNGMLATCTVQPSRIDFSLEPSPTPAALKDRSVALIDDTAVFSNTLGNIIIDIRKKIISEAMARVALYVQFMRISPSYLEANKELTTLIPKKYGRLSLTDEEDAILQINVPRGSKKVPGIRLNLLTKWSVERIQVFTLTIPQPGMALQGLVFQPPQDAKQFIAPSIVFDYSSTLEKVTPFDAAQQADLLSEALEIVSETQKEIGLRVEGF